MTSLDLAHALGVPVLNFNIAFDFESGVLKGLILGYMELGGIQIQITCISAERLKEAYERPDLHRDHGLPSPGMSSSPPSAAISRDSLCASHVSSLHKPHAPVTPLGKFPAAIGDFP